MEKLSIKHADSGGVQIAYARGLVCLSCKQKLPELKETIKKLENLGKSYAVKEEIPESYAVKEYIQEGYAGGLAILACSQELPEREETVRKLESLFVEYADNTRIGKKEVKGREAVRFTFEFFVCYPYNIRTMYE